MHPTMHTKCVTLPPSGLFTSLTVPSALFQVHFHHQPPSISTLPCFDPCLLAHQHLTNKEKYISRAATHHCQKPSQKQNRRVVQRNKNKNQGLAAVTQSCIFLPPQPREGRELTMTTATYAKAKATSAPTTTMKSRMFQRSRK